MAAIVHTDPPYGVSYEAGAWEAIAGDERRRDDLVALLLAALRLAVEHARDDAAFYVWHASATREDFTYALKAAGLEERQYLVWAKGRAVLGHAHYQWAHEPCFYASKAGQQAAWHGDRTQQTVWRLATGADGSLAIALGRGLLVSDGQGHELFLAPAPRRKLRHVRLGPGEHVEVLGGDSSGTVWEVAHDTVLEHPTQKPVELARRAIVNSSAPGEIVVDPFLGSGSTLIAAEVEGRRCVGFELEPRYVDVVLRRWEILTDRAARRERSRV